MKFIIPFSWQCFPQCAQRNHSLGAPQPQAYPVWLYLKPPAVLVLRTPKKGVTLDKSWT